VPYYRRAGEVPAKRHTLARRGGGVLHEELVGSEGFAEESCLLYHLHSPSAIVAVEAVPEPTACFGHDQPVQPRHLQSWKLAAEGDSVSGHHALLANDEVVIGFVAAVADGPLVRNAIGDELWYVQSGRARLETAFGPLEVADGDYVVIPAGITHRWVLNGGPTLEALVLRARGHIGVPAKYLTPRGQMGEGAPFTERDLRAPGPPNQHEDSEVPVLVRTAGGLTRMVHRHHPFDVVGWDGCLYPYALSIRDFEPIVGSLHQPPPVHQTFTGPGVAVCSFVPRPFDFHPEAVKIPYHHSNVDCDEVLFYSGGDFMSRKGAGIRAGSVSYHPAGFVHGPQPGSLEASMDKNRTEETAVMIDTFRPLRISEAARSISDPDYARSWLDRS
jgi:homogentisate 1,2-dioxygenase